MPKQSVDYDEVARVWNESPNVSVAAQRLGISERATYSRVRYARRRGLELRSVEKSALDYDDFVRRYNAANSDIELATEMGVSLSLIRQRAWLARTHGHILNQRRVTSNDYAYLAALLDEKSSIDNYGTQGRRRLRLSIASKEVLDFVRSVFPGGSVEESRGGFRITWQKPEEINKILDATRKYRKITNNA